MATVTKDGKRLYLRAWEYNAAWNNQADEETNAAILKAIAEKEM